MVKAEDRTRAGLKKKKKKREKKDLRKKKKEKRKSSGHPAKGGLRIEGGKVKGNTVASDDSDYALRLEEKSNLEKAGKAHDEKRQVKNENRNHHPGRRKEETLSISLPKKKENSFTNHQEKYKLRSDREKTVRKLRADKRKVREGGRQMSWFKKKKRNTSAESNSPGGVSGKKKKK